MRHRDKERISTYDAVRGQVNSKRLGGRKHDRHLGVIFSLHFEFVAFAREPRFIYARGARYTQQNWFFPDYISLGFFSRKR